MNHAIVQQHQLLMGNTVAKLVFKDANNIYRIVKLVLMDILKLIRSAKN